MTLPANDAFTLGLTGSHDSSRPSYPLSLPSASPKIPFVSGSKSSSRSSSRQYSGSQQAAKSFSRRSMSNGSANDPTKGASAAQHARKTSESTAAGQKPNGVAKRKATAPIDWEIPRKALHSSIGIVTLYLYTRRVPPRPVIIALSSFLALAVPVDILRLRSPAFERLFERCVGLFMRDSERKSTNGVIWYILGVIFVLAVYPVDVAVVSILILAFADTAASTIGRLWGYLTPPLPRSILGLPLAPRKSLAGFAAATLTGAVVVAGFWGWIVNLGVANSIWTWEAGLVEASGGLLSLSGWTGLGLISVVGGLVSGVAEALDLGSLDDNLTLPILSGGCIWGFMKAVAVLSS